MRLWMPFAVYFLSLIISTNAVAEPRPLLLEDWPQLTASEQLDEHDDGLDFFVDLSQPPAGVGSTPIANSELESTFDCYSSTDSLQPVGKLRARKPCDPLNFANPGKKRKSQHPAPAGTGQKNGNANGNGNPNGNGKQPDPGLINFDTAPLRTINDDGIHQEYIDPFGNQECLEFFNGILQFVVCDSGDNDSQDRDIVLQPISQIPLEYAMGTFKLRRCYDSRLHLR